VFHVQYDIIQVSLMLNFGEIKGVKEVKGDKDD
jgi:hypothetical protein